MAERKAEDVKRGPMPGDVLRRDNPTNRVKRLMIDPPMPSGLWFVETTHYCRKATVVTQRMTTINRFRKWARTAEVIRIAQPKEKTDGE